MRTHGGRVVAIANKAQIEKYKNNKEKEKLMARGLQKMRGKVFYLLNAMLVYIY